MLRIVLLASAAVLLPATAHAQEFSLGDVRASEANGKAQVPIDIVGQRDTLSLVTFYVGAPEDTAIPTEDYGLTAVQLVVQPTDARLLVDIPLVDDAIVKGTRKLTTKLVVNRGGTTRDDTGVVEILENDYPPLKLTVTPQLAEVPETIGTMPGPRVSRSGGDPSVVVRYAYQTINGTAASPADFSARSGGLAGTATTMGSVPIVNDTLVESNETFIYRVRAYDSVTNQTLAQVDTSITIVSDDLPPKAPVSVIEGACNEGDLCQVLLQRSGGDLSREATVTFSVANDTAVSPQDFIAATGTATIAAGSAQGSFTFQSVENSIDAPDKTVSVSIGSTTDPIGTAIAFYKIVDDDEAPPPVICPDGTTLPAGSTCPTPPPPTNDTWVKCIDTNFTCYIEGTAKVRYGNATVGWMEISPVTSSIQCTREIFRATQWEGLPGLICQTTGKPISQTAVPVDTSGGPGWHRSPTPDGEVPINQSQGTLVDVGVIPENSAAPDTVGAFRFTCKVGAVNNNDSILYPGKPGISHSHTNYGLSSGNDGYDTYATLQTKPGFGTCESIFNAEPNNRSAYWRPSMIVNVPAGATIPEKVLTLQPGQPKIGGTMTKMTPHIWLPDHITFYYKRAPSASPGCQPSTSPWGVTIKGCVPIPHGLKAIFGYNMAAMKDGQEPGRFRCLGVDGAQIGPYSSRIADALKNCPVGARFTGSITAPQCWDSRYLDSPDHQSHMSHSQQRLGTGKGGCRYPLSGAKEVVVPPALTILNSWTVTAAVKAAVDADPEWGVHLDSDLHLKAMRPLEAWAGRTEHADAFFSWNNFVRDLWTFGGRDKNGVFQKGCIEGLKNCSSMNFGMGKASAGSNGAPYYKSLGYTSWGHPNNLVPVRPEGWTADW